MVNESVVCASCFHHNCCTFIAAFFLLVAVKDDPEGIGLRE